MPAECLTERQLSGGWWIIEVAVCHDPAVSLACWTVGQEREDRVQQPQLVASQSTTSLNAERENQS